MGPYFFSKNIPTDETTTRLNDKTTRGADIEKEPEYRLVIKFLGFYEKKRPSFN